jgi:competence protein ComEA
VDPDDPLEALTERSRVRTTRVRIGVGAALVLLLAAFAIAIVVSVSGGGAHSVAAPVVAVTATAAPDDAVTPSSMYVHVLGAVERPGLYRLGTGARVIDAVASAGGLTADADPSAVNLARPLGDGEQLVVPHVGDPAPANGSSGAGGAAGVAGVAGVAGAKVNLNTATTDQLDTLPRVGPAMAQKIVQWREQNGRFASIDDLMNVSGIGQKTFDGLKDLVTI